MARLSINETTTYRWSLEEDLENYRAAGIEGIGVWRQKLTDCGEQRGIDLLLQSGLCASNLLWAGGFTGSEGHTYRESVHDATEAVRLAAAIHAGCLVVYSGPRNGHTQNHARRLFKGALQEILPQAADLGVTLAIEPMHAGCASDWTFLTSLEDTLELIASIGSAHLKLTFDTYHLGHDPDIVDKIGQFAQHIAIVHLGDGKQPPHREQNRFHLGEGNLPLRQMIQTLTEHGYDGFYDVELIGEEIEASNYRELIQHSKQAFEYLTYPPAQLQA